MLLTAAAYQRQVAATEKKLAKFYDAASKQLDDGLELKAVFVTFNSQVERAECQAQCPKRKQPSWHHLCVGHLHLLQHCDADTVSDTC